MDNLLVLLAIFGVMIVMVWTVNSKIQDLEKRRAKNQERIVAIEKQILQEEKRFELLKDRSEYVQSRAYIEDIAKEKLGLIYPNEIIIRPEE